MVATQLSDALASNQLVTFKWYAQQYGVPAEEAKAALQEFVEANAFAHAVYLLVGSIKGDNWCASPACVRHGTHTPRLSRCARRRPVCRRSVQYKLVEAAKLEEAKQAFESVTCHVYSVHTARPSSGEAIWNLNHQQDRGLYAKVTGAASRQGGRTRVLSCLCPGVRSSGARRTA